MVPSRIHYRHRNDRVSYKTLVDTEYDIAGDILLPGRTYRAGLVIFFILRTCVRLAAYNKPHTQRIISCIALYGNGSRTEKVFSSNYDVKVATYLIDVNDAAAAIWRICAFHAPVRLHAGLYFCHYILSRIHFYICPQPTFCYRNQYYG